MFVAEILMYVLIKYHGISCLYTGIADSAEIIKADKFFK